MLSPEKCVSLCKIGTIYNKINVYYEKEIAFGISHACTVNWLLG